MLTTQKLEQDIQDDVRIAMKHLKSLAKKWPGIADDDLYWKVRHWLDEALKSRTEEKVVILKNLGSNELKTEEIL